MAGSITEAQRWIKTRELPPDYIQELRRRTLNGLALLQEQAVQAQSIPNSDKAQREITIAQKAAINAVWAMRAIPVVSEILLKTGEKIEFTQGFFTRSAINCEAIGVGEERHVALRFGLREIAKGTESGIFEGAWRENFRGARRNMQALASLSPLEVIGKAYSAVYRI